jgi:hypothetical protein
MPILLRKHPVSECHGVFASGCSPTGIRRTRAGPSPSNRDRTCGIPSRRPGVPGEAARVPASSRSTEDAEQPQDDDQTQRHAEQPQNQRHHRRSPPFACLASAGMRRKPRARVQTGHVPPLTPGGNHPRGSLRRRHSVIGATSCPGAQIRLSESPVTRVAGPRRRRERRRGGDRPATNSRPSGQDPPCEGSPMWTEALGIQSGIAREARAAASLARR